MKYVSQSDEKKNELILPRIFRPYAGLTAGMSTRLGAVNDSGYGMNLSFKVGDDPANVNLNRKKFFSKLNITEDQLAVPGQCHSINVTSVDKSGDYADCDALITGTKQLALSITVADCVPVLIYDTENNVIAAVHAGWRGTAGNISGAAVKKLKNEFHSDPSNIMAFIGPSAGTCCYEVGPDVAVMFGNKVVHYNGGRIFVDLKEQNKLHLQEEGILPDNIEVSKYCTICNSELFHSYRRDGKKAGRMIAVICINR